MIFSLNEVIKNMELILLCFYSDIIFDLKSINYLKIKKKISTLVDSNWLSKWKLKKNYLNDLEDLRILNGKIISLGKKVKNKNIDGRFVGITKFSKEIIAKLIKENFFKKI